MSSPGQSSLEGGEHRMLDSINPFPVISQIETKWCSERYAGSTSGSQKSFVF